MKVCFKINYHTTWGENLFLYGDIKELGGGDPVKAIPMQLIGADTWSVCLEIPAPHNPFRYGFVVRPSEGAWRFEWGPGHLFRVADGVKECILQDSWQDTPHNKAYYSSAFVDGILMRQKRQKAINVLPGHVLLRVQAPMVQPDETLAITGSCPALGKWDPTKALLLNDAFYPTWEIQFPIDDVQERFEYKLLIVDAKTREVREWEAGANRVFELRFPSFQDKETTCEVIDGLRMDNPRNHWRGAGTAIPVFSMRSADDNGVGDFEDIRLMADWCAKTGQKILQLLPINDTTLTGTELDSYPYRANSTFALHPMYLRVDKAGTLANPDRARHFATVFADLNALEAVDYVAVNRAKEEYMRELYAQEHAALEKKKGYKDFVKANEHWLRPYAAWSLLRDQYGTPDNTRWEHYANYDPQLVDQLIAANKKEIGYFYFVQYHLDRQLREARDYAHSLGVILKGDIPIGIGRFSVDAWLYPNLFNMNSQAGAPPDDFSVLGQNWGFPTYNWEEMAKDGFRWWRDRFGKMAEYFDAYRIDHILGFFRIWQIPLDALHGLLGVFYPALPFSPDELRHSYDFWLNVDVQTKPLILEWMLYDFFGEHTAKAKEKFLEPTDTGRYKLRQFVSTQKRVAEYFATQEKNPENERICNALLGLIDDVLFIEDPEEKGKYHPRIAAQYTYQYRCLSDYERWTFDRLYNDFYYHRNDEFWRGKALWKLPPLLNATGMLACAEDLGMIPACVPQVMNDLQILSLEIERMPKDPKLEFGNPSQYPYLSVCTTSTHDMPGIRQWWESDHQMAQRYYNFILGCHGEAPFFAEPWICDRIIDRELYSPSMLCIIPLQDWLSTDGEIRRQDPREEQINVPANPEHYWRYRMHLGIEELMQKEVFNDVLLSKIKHSGR